MKLRFWMSALVLVTVCWSMPAVTYAAQSGKTCHDFEYQEDAQEYWDAGNGRPTADYFGLDGNNDGIACNSLPPKPATDTSLSMYLGPVAVIIAVSGLGVWWTRRRDGAAKSAEAVPSKGS